jgi:hypothetical protein
MNTPASGTPNSLDWLRQRSDSPWFWLLLFVNAALVGMLLIGPKYRQRQAMLERRYEARRDAGRRQSAVDPEQEPVGGPPVVGEPHAGDHELLVPLWPLAALLVAVDMAATCLWLRQRGSHSPADKPPSEPA